MHVFTEVRDGYGTIGYTILSSAALYGIFSKWRMMLHQKIIGKC